MIDQLPLWDEDADSRGPAPAEPTPEAEPRLERSIEPVSQQAPAAGAPRTHCPAGHTYDEANTYVDRHGWRSCRACKRVSDRRRRERTAKRLTPEQRIMRSRLAAYRLHATHDARDTTRKAREAFASRFERQVDPDGLLPPAERAQRADAARRAYFVGLALRSSQARRGKPRN